MAPARRNPMIEIKNVSKHYGDFKEIGRAHV